MSKTNKKKLSLTMKILIGLLVGAFLGISLFYINDYFKFSGIALTIYNVLIEAIHIIGQAFIRLMQMLVIPLVFCSIVCGSMSMGDTKKLGKIGIKTMAFYLATTALAVIVALTIANIFDPGIGVNSADLLKGAEQVKPTTTEQLSISQQILNIIPENIFASISKGDMLPIIFFALVIGIVISKLGDKVETVSNIFSEFNDIMMKMTMMIMKIAPIGVLCLVAYTFSNTGLQTILPIMKYMITVLIALAIQCFVVYLTLLFVFTGLNPIVFIKNFVPVMQFAFSTATSTATIPVSIDTLANKIGVSKKVSSFTIPLGATINMDGTAIMQGVAVVFAAQLTGIHLSLADYATVIATATIASVGTAGVPGVGLTTLIMVFKSVGLPIAPIGIIMGIDRLLDMARTAVNVTGDAVCTTIVAKGSGNLDKDIYYGKKHSKVSE